MKKRLVIIVVVLIGCLFASYVTPESINPLFYGRWKYIESKVFMPNGTSFTQPDVKCIREATADRTISECTLPDGRISRIVSKILSLNSNVYEIETIENSLDSSNVGIRSRIEYRFEGNKMFTASHRVGSKTNSPTKIETIYIRE